MEGKLHKKLSSVLRTTRTGTESTVNAVHTVVGFPKLRMRPALLILLLLRGHNF